MALQGNDVLLYFYLNESGGLWIPIGCSRSHDIQVGTEMIEVSSPTSGQWKQYITGRKEWQVTVNYLVLQRAQIRDLLQVGTTLQVVFKQRNEANSTGVVGYATIKTCKITATRGNMIQGSFVFQGSGELT